MDFVISTCRPNLRFLIKVLNGQLVVPDFLAFSHDLSALAQLVESDRSGANADYIPPLRCYFLPIEKQKCRTSSGETYRQRLLQSAPQVCVRCQ